MRDCLTVRPSKKKLPLPATTDSDLGLPSFQKTQDNNFLLLPCSQLAGVPTCLAVFASPIWKSFHVCYHLVNGLYGWWPPIFLDNLLANIFTRCFRHMHAPDHPTREGIQACKGSAGIIPMFPLWRCDKRRYISFQHLNTTRYNLVTQDCHTSGRLRTGYQLVGVCVVRGCVPLSVFVMCLCLSAYQTLAGAFCVCLAADDKRQLLSSNIDPFGPKLN